MSCINCTNPKPKMLMSSFTIYQSVSTLYLVIVCRNMCTCDITDVVSVSVCSTCVNGAVVSSPVQLLHGDRILWGNNHFFRSVRHIYTWRLSLIVCLIWRSQALIFFLWKLCLNKMSKRCQIDPKPCECVLTLVLSLCLSQTQRVERVSCWCGGWGGEDDEGWSSRWAPGCGCRSSQSRLQWQQLQFWVGTDRSHDESAGKHRWETDSLLQSIEPVLKDDSGLLSVLQTNKKNYLRSKLNLIKRHLKLMAALYQYSSMNFIVES